jgi:Holliday junction resolvase RusA-like endonuclease
VNISGAVSSARSPRASVQTLSRATTQICGGARDCCGSCHGEIAVPRYSPQATRELVTHVARQPGETGATFPGGVMSTEQLFADSESPAAAHASQLMLTIDGVEFEIPGQPVAKARARTQPLYRGGKPVIANGRVMMHSYTPEKTERYENRVAMAAREAMGDRDPFTRPVEVHLRIGVEVPASWSERKRRKALAGLIGATKKPDKENIEKAVMDGMNRIVYDDDAKIVRTTSSKFYTTRPGVQVQVIVLPILSA